MNSYICQYGWVNDILPQKEDPRNPRHLIHLGKPQTLSARRCKTSSEQQVEYLLSNLMKYGVLIASVVVLVGGILYLIHHGAEPAGYRYFSGRTIQIPLTSRCSKSSFIR